LAEYATEITFDTHFEREFEQGGVDVRLHCCAKVDRELPLYGGGYSSVYWAPITRGFRTLIEIKPTVGDDYPAVLRQMRANYSDVLFLQSYVGAGATEEQFIATLHMSGIKVVFRRDVDSAPPVDQLDGTLALPTISDNETA
jgi:hypothetical protein